MHYNKELIIKNINDGETFLGIEFGSTLSEREASQIIAFHDSIELRILFLQSHHAGTCEHDS